jgi:hypothetical protein
LTLNPALRPAGVRRIGPYVTAGSGWRRGTVELTRPAAQVITAYDPFWGALHPAAVPVTQALSVLLGESGRAECGGGFRLQPGRRPRQAICQSPVSRCQHQPRRHTITATKFGVR